MGAVDVGIGEQDDLVIAGFLDVEIIPDAGAHGGEDVLHLGVLQGLGQPCLLDVEDLAPDGEDRLGVGVPGRFGRPGGRLALDDEQLRLPGPSMSSRPACREGPRTRGPTSAASARALRAASGLGGADALVDDAAGFWGISLQPFGELAVQRLLDVGADLGVTQLGLGLTLELGLLTRTERTAVRPSRTSSPVRFSSFSLSSPWPGRSR